ncbi:MAG: hypothetical protein J6J60_05820 [Clostridia bacterium]|nr:hypothetical protein [Clostridia bacterium]
MKVIIKNARVDYFRENKYIFNEEGIEDKILYAKDEVEEEVAKRTDNLIQAEELERIFTDKNMSKNAKVLTYDEKLVLYLYFVEEKTDEEIGDILFLHRSTITKRRKKALKKLKDKYEKGENKDV